MDREWLTVRLLQIDIAVLVVVVLVGIAVITARLARDPSESIVRWWQGRARMSVPLVEQPVVTAAASVRMESADAGRVASDAQVHAPEWLERLIGRKSQAEAEPAGGPRVQGEAGPGRRVA